MEKLVARNYWRRLIEQGWQRRSVVWLAGVRRTGKTSLAQTVENVDYFDCERPRTRQMMADPEGFLSGLKDRQIVLDEIHRLKRPAEMLKIAADHFPGIKVLATGSSTLSASRKFRDTLTGRKTNIWLTPMITSDIADFNQGGLEHRLLRGGLPPFYLAARPLEEDFQEWMDDYWAKDIQELFRLERRDSFQRFIELIMARSGGIFEANKFTDECEVSRRTIANYLRVLESTHVAHIVRPFSTRRSTEIISAPKVYGFDTGFVCYYRGWDQLRPDDMGILWEHYVLNEIHARLQSKDILYWRDKRGHEIDFILASRNQNPTAIECKWRASAFDSANLKVFRRQYPKGDNFTVCSDVDRSFTRQYGLFHAEFVSLTQLLQRLMK